MMDRTQIQLDSLIEDDHYYETVTSSTQDVFKFKDGLYRGLLGVPKQAQGNIWFRYFVKGDSDSYHRSTEKSPLPDWFQYLVDHADSYVEKRDRLRKMFITPEQLASERIRKKRY